MKKMALFEKEEEEEEEEEGKGEEKKAKNFDAVEKEAAEENKVSYIISRNNEFLAKGEMAKDIGLCQGFLVLCLSFFHKSPSFQCCL